MGIPPMNSSSFYLEKNPEFRVSVSENAFVVNAYAAHVPKDVQRLNYHNQGKIIIIGSPVMVRIW